jgi:signal transduction histidine kinase
MSTASRAGPGDSRNVVCDPAEALGRLVENLAHAARNALQRSQACLELLVLEVGAQPGALELVERLQQAQDDLVALLDQVRRYAEVPCPKRAPCDLRHAVGEAWSELEGLRVQYPARLSEQPTSADLVCRVDRSSIRRAFREILKNACEAGAALAQIDVAWSSTQLAEDQAVRVTFRNQGPGLSAEQQRRLFEPFYTTKPRASGLGLAIARKLVEAHGGEIHAKNASSGVEVVVTLPRRGAP